MLTDEQELGADDVGAGRWALDNAEGLHAYLIVKASVWQTAKGTDSRRIEYASSLAAAKASYGYTREMHTTVKVRRATPADLDAAQGSAPSPLSLIEPFRLLSQENQ